MINKKRCQWCEGDQLYEQYHDEEWGAPLFDDDELFEFLILEGAQAGLSWITVLRKRAAYHDVFDGFNVKKIAKYSDAELNKALLDPGIIRNRLKVYSMRQNARAFLSVQQEYGCFSDYLWAYVGYKSIQHSGKSSAQLSVTHDLSVRLSKDLKKHGFNFVGPTIVYAFMQATGMVNDHTDECFRQSDCKSFSF